MEGDFSMYAEENRQLREYDDLPPPDRSRKLARLLIKSLREQDVSEDIIEEISETMNNINDIWTVHCRGGWY